MTRRREVLVRQLRIVDLMTGRRYGISVRELLERLKVGRSTIPRDLAVLREAGMPLATERRNGEARYSLLGDGGPPLRPTPLELNALRFARTMLTPLEGSQLMRRLDSLIVRAARCTSNTEHVVSTPASQRYAGGVVAKLERALSESTRLRLSYRGARDTTVAARLIEPLGLRFTGDDLYIRRTRRREERAARVQSGTDCERRRHP